MGHCRIRPPVSELWLFGYFLNIDFVPHRFRQVPTYGLDTIRKFSNNVSAMKKLAARDFEDILQVCPLKTTGDVLK